MRLRYVKGSDEEVLASPYVLDDPEAQRGNWQALTHGRPLRLEIGMGRGRFLMAQAARHPECFFVGIEKYASVLVKAVEAQEAQALPNVLFLHVKAERLPDFFAPGEVDRIYLNFSDPWPKLRHAKHRLTSTRFLERYTHVLRPEGLVEFKTDNVGLYDSSLESLAEAGWTLLARTRDLHRDPVQNCGNIMTEYEEKFSAAGKPIGKLTFRQPR